MTDNTKPGDKTVGGRTVCGVCEKAEVEYTRRKWAFPVCYGCMPPGEGPQRRKSDPDFDDRVPPDDSHSRGIREGLERAATWHDSIASNPNAQALEAMTHKASAIYLRAEASKLEDR
jgi:hypothetical protein